MSITVVRHRFSVGDYEQMIQAGILSENDRVELIRGEIIEKMPIGDQHAACVKRLNKVLGRLLGDRAIISVQDPIRLADSEPEPDIAVLRPRPDFYATGKPGPDDVLLVIEVADTSLDFDRTVKRPLYAESRIPELWIVNLEASCIEVYRQPSSDGTYGYVEAFSRDRQLTMALRPDVLLAVPDILA